MSRDARDDVTRGVPRAPRAQGSVLAVGLPNSRDPPCTRGTSRRVRRRRAVLAVLFSAASGANAASVACGQSHTCAILNVGTVWCWGTNDSGRLGIGSTGGSSAAPVGPLDLGSGRTAKAICAGRSHSCAILDDGTVKCWGPNGNGQLGYGDTTTRDAPPATPVDLGTGRTAKAVSCKWFHTCAILDDDSLMCWGYNYHGQLGVGDNGGGTNKASPTAVVATNLGAGVKSVATGHQHTCAVLNDGSLKCWGSPVKSIGNSLGYGDNNNGYGDNNAPPAENVNLGAGLTAKSVSATYGHTCVILNDNTLKCYGANGASQLGYGDTTARSIPDANAIDLGSGKTATSVSTGSDRLENSQIAIYLRRAQRREREVFRRKLLRTARNWVVHATSRKSSGYGGPRHGADGNGHIAGRNSCVRRIGRRLHKMLGAKQRRASWNRVAFLLRRRDARRGRLLIQLRRLKLRRLELRRIRRERPSRPSRPSRVVVVIGERHERPSRSSRVVVVIGKRHVHLCRGAAGTGRTPRSRVPQSERHGRRRRQRRDHPRQHPGDIRLFHRREFPDVK